MSAPANEWRVLPAAPCEGCHGADHGSVGIGRICLQNALKQARRRIRELEGELVVKAAR